jgi:uncharacterized protein YhaN
MPGTLPVKTTLTSILMLALAGVLLLPEPVSAASNTAASATASTTLYFWGGNRRPTRKVKKVRTKQYHSSAAKAYAKRTRRASF